MDDLHKHIVATVRHSKNDEANRLVTAKITWRVLKSTWSHRIYAATQTESHRNILRRFNVDKIT